MVSAISQKYFGTLFPFCLVSLYHKWNGTRLSSTKVECPSCHDPRLKILGNKEILGKPQNWVQPYAQPTFQKSRFGNS